MATPIHPNQFALQQKVLFRAEGDTRWREGIVASVKVDDTKSRERHGDGCDEYQYEIRDPRYDSYLASQVEKATATGCLCDIFVADADSTGRWYGQRLGGAIGLQLLLVDTMRRGAHVATDPAVSEVDDEADPDVVRLLEMPGYHHLASARADDLVAWASGIPAAEWKVPVE